MCRRCNLRNVPQTAVQSPKLTVQGSNHTLCTVARSARRRLPFVHGIWALLRGTVALKETALRIQSIQEKPSRGTLILCLSLLQLLLHVG